MARSQGSFRLRSRLLAGAAFLLVQAGVQAAPWREDSAARSDYERMSRQSRKSAGSPEFPTMRLSMRTWLSKGHGITRSGYPFPDLICEGLNCFLPLKSQAALGNTVDFQDKAHPLLVFNYELRVHRRLSFDVEVGGSGYGEGRASDHQWLHSPNFILTYAPTDTTWRQPSNIDWGMSKANIKGDTRMLSSNAYFRVLILPNRVERGENKIRQAFDVFAGYTLYQDTFRLSDGSQIITDRTYFAGLVRPEGPYSGLDSKYRFRWEGFRFGLREEIDLPGKWSVQGRFAYSPDLEYQGEGFWNKEKAIGVGAIQGKSLKPEGANSLQTARGGSFDGMVAVGYSPWRFLSVEMGYLYMFFKGGRGTDKILYDDGSFEDIELERVTSKRNGLFAGMTLKY
ncbi:MAG: hypothetical protein HZB91_04015 [Elusimicrobia bacterium]|nr:hypothetical protein [Elusimicrobiota bacterium]